MGRFEDYTERSWLQKHWYLALGVAAGLGLIMTGGMKQSSDYKTAGVAVTLLFGAGVLYSLRETEDAKRKRHVNRYYPRNDITDTLYENSHSNKFS